MIWQNVQFQSEETIENLAQMSKVFLDKGKFVRRKTWELYPSQGTCGCSFATRKFDSLLANKKRKRKKKKHQLLQMGLIIEFRYGP